MVRLTPEEFHAVYEEIAERLEGAEDEGGQRPILLRVMAKLDKADGYHRCIDEIPF